MAWLMALRGRSLASPPTMQDTDEIGFRAGGMIRVLEKEGEWWKGTTIDGKTGL